MHIIIIALLIFAAFGAIDYFLSILVFVFVAALVISLIAAIGEGILYAILVAIGCICAASLFVFFKYSIVFCYNVIKRFPSPYDHRIAKSSVIPVIVSLIVVSMLLAGMINTAIFVKDVNYSELETRTKSKWIFWEEQYQVYVNKTRKEWSWYSYTVASFAIIGLAGLCVTGYECRRRKLKYIDVFREELWTGK